MKNPELADRILKYLHDHPQLTDSGPIALAIGEDLHMVNRTCDEIKVHFRNWFSFRQVANRNFVSFIFINHHIAELDRFLKSGGFSAIARAEVMKQQRKEEREQLEIDSLKAAVEQVKIAREQANLAAHQAFEAEKSAKHSKWVAIISLIVAVISAAAAVWPLLQKK